MERAVGYVEVTARQRGIESPVQMTVGISDGERFWAVRYSSQHDSRTLFCSEDVDAVRRLHPDNERLRLLSEGDRIVVSEPAIGPCRRMARGARVNRTRDHGRRS
jgi:glutamine amidotransferase